MKDIKELEEVRELYDFRKRRENPEEIAKEYKEAKRSTIMHFLIAITISLVLTTIPAVVGVMSLYNKELKDLFLWLMITIYPFLFVFAPVYTWVIVAKARRAKRLYDEFQLALEWQDKLELERRRLEMEKELERKKEREDD